jgi:hypothetical protein
MIALWLAALADASAQQLERTGVVESLTWARPFVLATPEPDPTAWPRGPTFTEGWLLEVRVEPGLLVPTDGAEPWFYVGETPALKLNWDWVGGCLVAIVPGRPDLASTPMLLGAPPRPGLDGAGRRALARSEAARMQVAPLPGSLVSSAVNAGGPVLHAADLRDVHAAGMARVAACTSTDADRARAGIPGR